MITYPKTSRSRKTDAVKDALYEPESPKTETFRFGELFCGPGGIALGALNSSVRQNGITYKIQHAWANDYDKDTCETYRRNICPEAKQTVVCRDIRKLDFSVLTDISNIDALAFGFPCNDFSVVGEQKGMEGVYGALYSYGIQALRIFKPQWFLAENVGGLRNSNEGNALDVILEEMHKVGYQVFPHLYKFENYGIPQARHRIIIVGIRNDLHIEFKIPSPEQFAHIDVSARNAIESPPIPDDANNNERTSQSAQVVARLKHIRPGQNAFTANLPENLRLNVRGAKISQIYKRLDPDKPAYTITGSGGGGTHVYHWKQDRALTNRERARLQTFPDDFVFCGSKESVRKQIGMAVPPRGIRVVFEAVLKTFAGIKYPSIGPNLEPRTSRYYEQMQLLEKRDRYAGEKSIR